MINMLEDRSIRRALALCCLFVAIAASSAVALVQELSGAPSNIYEDFFDSVVASIPASAPAGSNAERLLAGTTRNRENVRQYDAVVQHVDDIPSVYLEEFISTGWKLCLEREATASDGWRDENCAGVTDYVQKTIFLFSRADVGTLYHEFAHYIADRMGMRPKIQNAYIAEDGEEAAVLLGDYCRKSSAEFFAETFRHYMLYPKERLKLKARVPQTYQLVRQVFDEDAAWEKLHPEAEVEWVSDVGEGAGTASGEATRRRTGLWSNGEGIGNGLDALEDVGGFRDVAGDSPNSAEIAQVSAFGLMRGTSETTFSPEEEVTVGMLAAVLYRLAGSPYGDGTSVGWFIRPVAWLGAQGLTEPQDAVVTQEVLDWAVDKGFWDEETFRPQGVFTRGQLAALACELLKKADVL